MTPCQRTFRNKFRRRQQNRIRLSHSFQLSANILCMYILMACIAYIHIAYIHSDCVVCITFWLQIYCPWCFITRAGQSIVKKQLSVEIQNLPRTTRVPPKFHKPGLSLPSAWARLCVLSHYENLHFCINEIEWARKKIISSDPPLIFRFPLFQIKTNSFKTSILRYLAMQVLGEKW